MSDHIQRITRADGVTQGYHVGSNTEPSHRPTDLTASGAPEAVSPAALADRVAKARTRFTPPQQVAYNALLDELDEDMPLTDAGLTNPAATDYITGLAQRLWLSRDTPSTSLNPDDTTTRSLQFPADDPYRDAKDDAVLLLEHETRTEVTQVAATDPDADAYRYYAAVEDRLIQLWSPTDLAHAPPADTDTDTDTDGDTCDNCDESVSDGDGYDGLCGSCADQVETFIDNADEDTDWETARRATLGS